MLILSRGDSPVFDWLTKWLGRKPETDTKPGGGPGQPDKGSAKAESDLDNELARIQALKRARAVRARLEAIRIEQGIPEDTTDDN